MSNPSNLIRPPVLTNPPNNSNITQSSNPPQQRQNEVQLASLITQITSNILREELPHLIQAALNPNAHTVTNDQIIDEQNLNNLSDLEKVPDVVKCIRDFSGKPGEFSSWKKSVDRILNVYEGLKGTPKYYGILNVVRSKIVGSADIALESYNTPLDWTAISRCLALHYADKRDLSTLEYQMTTLVQGRKSVQEFYQAVYTHLSLILNKISCLEVGREAIGLLTQSYREKALDTFVRGLNGDLPMLLGIREPADLPQALHLCLKLENQTFRANYARNSQQNRQMQSQNYLPPPLPPRNHLNAMQTNKAPFYPQLAYIPQNPQYPQRNYNVNHQRNQPNQPTHYYNRQLNYQQNYQPNPPYYYSNNQTNYQQRNLPPRPQEPKPLPKPEPMEVDESLHSRKINYMNRPQHRQQQPAKRPPPPGSLFLPQKVQRNFHIDTTDYDYREDPIQDNEEQLDPANEYLADYLALSEANSSGEVAELSDIHFLE